MPQLVTLYLPTAKRLPIRQPDSSGDAVPKGLLWNGNFCAGSVSYLSHEAALQQAGTQATASKAWRLPNVKELASIADIYRNPNPAIDTASISHYAAGQVLVVVALH